MNFAQIKGSILVILMSVLVILFQNCAANKQASTSNKLVRTNPLELDWTYSNGAVAPEYAHSVIYKIDYVKKALSIVVTKGAQDTTQLPSSGTYNLTDIQLTQVTNLLGAIASTECSTGASQSGGDSNYLSVYYKSISNVDFSIHNSSCAGMTSTTTTHYLQAQSGYNALTDFIRSL